LIVGAGEFGTANGLRRVSESTTQRASYSLGFAIIAVRYVALCPSPFYILTEGKYWFA
jgi:hypothetical protein